MKQSIKILVPVFFLLAGCLVSQVENEEPITSLQSSSSVTETSSSSNTGICTTDWSPVCGTDGLTYSNTCVAEAQGASVLSSGECESGDTCVCANGSQGILGQRSVDPSGTEPVFDQIAPEPTCSCPTSCPKILFVCDENSSPVDSDGDGCSDSCSEAVDSGCAAQDAQGEGLCEAYFGTYWDGKNCTGYSGCACVGEDCDKAYADMESCQVAHSTCEEPVICPLLGCPPNTESVDNDGDGCMDECKALAPAPWNRSSVADNPQSCSSIKFTCATNSWPYNDETGCGCEQNNLCPEYIINTNRAVVYDSTTSKEVPSTFFLLVAPTWEPTSENCPLSIVVTAY